MKPPTAYRRISIVGTSGSGKSTFAKALAAKLNYPCVELDSLFHGPDWTTASDDEFRSRVKEWSDRECWVIEGNYNKVRPLVWARADLIIWLDYPLHITLTRIIRRTWRRVRTKEELWNGNRESWRKALSKESMILWVLQTYHRRKREMPKLLESYPSSEHLRLRHPSEARAWLLR